MPANGAGVARDDSDEAGGAGGRTVHADMSSEAAMTHEASRLRLMRGRGCAIVF